MRIRTLLIAFVGVACGKDEGGATAAGAPAVGIDAGPRAPVAADFVVHADGVDIRLGMKFAPEVEAKAPFDKPCDDNATGGQGEGMRSLVVYQADGCLRTAAPVPGPGGPMLVSGFPGQTSMVFYLMRPAGIGVSDTPLDQPIVAIAWMANGPGYLDRRSNFPLATGIAAGDVDQAFGAPAATLALPFGLMARRYGQDVFALIDGDRAVGYAVGELPAEATDSRWYVFAAVWTKHTRDVRRPDHDAAHECRRACVHAVDGAIHAVQQGSARMGAPPAMAEDWRLHREQQIENCSRQCATGRVQAACLLAGKTLEDWYRCQPH